MMIDCDCCVVRGPACDDCVVTVLLGAPPADRPGDGETVIDLDGNEQAALAVLAGCGLVPPLRLVAVPPPGDHGPGVRCSGRERPAGRRDRPCEDLPGGERAAI
jgi:hypothetical protein